MAAQLAPPSWPSAYHDPAGWTALYGSPAGAAITGSLGHGHGILLVPITGVLLTEMMQQQPPTLPLEPYQVVRLWQNAS